MERINAVLNEKDFSPGKKDRASEIVRAQMTPVSYTHLRAHETPEHLVCRLLLEKKKHTFPHTVYNIYIYNTT